MLMLLGYQLTGAAAADPLSPTSILVAQWGAWGVVVLALAVAVVKLWSDLKQDKKDHAAELTRLHKDQKEERSGWQTKNEEEHKTRLQDAKDNTKVLLEVASQSNSAVATLYEMMKMMKRYKTQPPPPS